jgi:hypothetical protein
MSGRRTKADRRRRQEADARERARKAEELAKHVERLACSAGAADDCDERCQTHLHDLDFEVELSTAISALWRRTSPDHPLTAVLDALLDEFERHRKAIEDLRTRLEPYWGKNAKHDHVEPSSDDVARLGKVIMGDDMPGPAA